MKPNRPSILEYASLGGGLADCLMLGMFGLIAPESNNSWLCRLGRRAHFVQRGIWLRPKKLGGLRLLIDPTDWSQTVIFEEVFLNSSYDLGKVKFTPDVVIDCGAHIGIFSLLARGKYPNAELIAYEPNRVNGEFIRRQIAKNRLDVSFNACAVSTESAKLSFVAINSHGAGWSAKSLTSHRRPTLPRTPSKPLTFPPRCEPRRQSPCSLRWTSKGKNGSCCRRSWRSCRVGRRYSLRRIMAQLGGPRSRLS